MTLAMREFGGEELKDIESEEPVLEPPELLQVPPPVPPGQQLQDVGAELDENGQVKRITPNV